MKIVAIKTEKFDLKNQKHEFWLIFTLKHQNFDLKWKFLT